MARNRTTQLLHGREWSKHIRWTVTLHIDHRGNTTAAEAICTYNDRGPAPITGHASTPLRPFDDLHDVLEVLLIDSAASCGEELWRSGI